MQKIMYALVVALVVSIGAATVDETVSQELQGNLVRLHIIANSDSTQDQDVKLKVRDEIIKSVSLDDKDFVNKAELTARRVLEQNGMNYSAKAMYGRFYFPKKKYENVTLPKGEYYGVRVELGNALGKNWWCIMYPPMCVVSDTEMQLTKSSSELLKSKISPQSYEIITSSDGKVKVKFKAVEIVESIREFFVKEFSNK